MKIVITKTKKLKKIDQSSFFNMLNFKEPVEQTMTKIRDGRYSNFLFKQPKTL